MTKTLAAIPAYNEEVAIGSVALRCRDFVDEVLVVDDGSSDHTADVARLAAASVQRHQTNQGKGVAIQSALKYARTNGFDAVVLLDGDGQHDPAYIPELLRPILEGQADVVLGVRKRTTSHVPAYRRLGQRVLDFVTAVGGSGTMTDSQCGFRALSRTAMENLALEERDFSIESEMLIDAQEKRLRIAEVPIRVRYDVDGSTKGPLSHGFGVVDSVLRIIAVRHPLFFFGVSGLAFLVASFFIGLTALDTYKRAPELAIGYSFLVVILLMIGLFAVFAGIMLNVLPRIVVRKMDDKGDRRN